MAGELYTVDAEQAVLGGLMLDNDAWERLAGRISEADFFSRDHRFIFRAIAHLAGDDQPRDAVTIAEHLDNSGDLEKLGGMGYLATLASNIPSAANIETHARIVRDRSERRRIAENLREMLDTLPSAESASEALADAQARLEAIAVASNGKAANWSTVLQAGLEAIDEAAARRQRGGTVGVPTGLPTLDARTGGIHGPRLWVAAARPSIGKSALTLQIALHAASRGHRAGILSLEMGIDEIAQRALANRLGLNLTKLAQGHDQELTAAAKGSGKLSKFGLFIDDDSYTLGAIVSRITEWRRRESIDFAIVDHIGLIEGEETASRVDHLGKVSRTLKKLAKRLDMPIVAVSQLNRGVEKEKRLPKLSDLRDSGNIEQDADICLFLHCEEADEERPEKRMKVGLLKNRGGVRGWLPRDFIFEGRTQRFRELTIADTGVAA